METVPLREICVVEVGLTRKSYCNHTRQQLKETMSQAEKVNLYSNIGEKTENEDDVNYLKDFH
jgi:hypothetical protein